MKVFSKGSIDLSVPVRQWSVVRCSCISFNRLTTDNDRLLTAETKVYASALQIVARNSRIVTRPTSSGVTSFQLRQKLRRLHHSRRFVAFAAEWDGRQIRTVRLDEQTLKRKCSRDGAQVVGLLKSEIAGE